MDETPEQKYKRISEAIQQTILRNYPNPERRGCPGSAVVREVAGRRELIEDDNWQHITHCSPCYAEFLNYKEEWRRRRRRWRDPQVLGAALAAVVAMFAGTYYLMHRETAPGGPIQVTQLEYRPAVLNLRNVSGNRGGNSPRPNSQVPVLLRDRLDLTITLPFASEAGVYDVQFQDSEHRTLISTEGHASINHGDTLVEVKWDLTKFQAGRYLVAWRQAPFGWTSTDVALK
jgi:hypothetical protein